MKLKIYVYIIHLFLLYNSIDIYSNLKDFVVDKDDDDLLIVEGNYEGEIELCVYGEGYEGYIVINDDIEPESTKTRTISVDDFIFTNITEFQY